MNFWEGCTKVSAGCANCYAEARDKRFTGGKLWGKGAPRRKSKSAVKDALRYNKLPWICDKCGGSNVEAVFDADLKQSLRGGVSGNITVCRDCNSMNYHRRRIFSLSLGDWLDDEVPIEWLAEMLDTIRQCSDVTWILCTKRPENFKERLTRVMMWFENTPCTKQGTSTWHWVLNWVTDISGVCAPKNIILLTSVENQEAADKRIPELLNIPAACRGLSLEPLLGPVDLEASLALWKPRAYVLSPRNYIDWLIIGGESGPNARPCNVDWIRSQVAQGNAAGVATFVKQMGTYMADGMRRCGHDVKDKKGGDPAEWPTDLRVQEWPKGF